MITTIIDLDQIPDAHHRDSDVFFTAMTPPTMSHTFLNLDKNQLHKANRSLQKLN